MSQDNSLVVFDFKKENSVAKWTVVDDGVMGGFSEGSISINSTGNGSFTGNVTTENNGGFSSVRLDKLNINAAKFEYIMLKLKGDGKDYQFRIKENSSQRFSYISTFKTSGEWEIIKIPLYSFYPTFRGTRLNQPNFSGRAIEEIAFFIGNKKKESFALEIAYIALE